jgi:uncharacterized damage-inducible protein DinB
MMTLPEYFAAQLDAEAPKTRRVLERVPAGKDDWKPHDKSMPFGRLAMLVAQMPSWFDLIVNKDDLDLTAGGNVNQQPLRTAADLVKAHDEAAASARKTLKGTNDAHLAKHWKLIAGGRVVADQPREIVIRDTFMHLSHHRAQLTVYLRLLGQPVPAIYGPSADDQTFA